MTGPQGWAAPDGPAGPAGPPPAAEPSGAGSPPAGAPVPPPGEGGPTAWTAPPTSPPTSPTSPPPPPGGGWQPPPGWGGPQGPRWGGPREVKPGIVPLRPLGLGEVLDGAVSVIRRYPRPTLGLAAVIAGVTALLQVPLLVATADSPLLDGSAVEPGTQIDLDGALGGFAAGFGASSLLTFLAGVVLAGIITAVVGKGVLGQPITLGESWRQVRPRLWSLLGLAFVVLAVVYGGFVLAVAVGVGLTVAAGGVGAVLGVPLALAGTGLAVWAYVRLSLAPSALVLERVGIRQSLRRSGALVKGDWLRVFGILLLTLVITTFVSSVLQAPFQVRSFLGGVSGGGGGLTVTDVLLQSIGATLALSLVAPFDAAVRALLYVDRRIRSEALDVQLLAATARGTAAGSPAGDPAGPARPASW